MILSRKIFSPLTSSPTSPIQLVPLKSPSSLISSNQPLKSQRVSYLRKPDSSLSPPESSMDDATSSDFRHRRRTRQSPATTDHRRPSFGPADDGDDSVGEVEEGGAEVWETFNDSFRRVQSVLDRNRVLIQQVNENHQSKIPDNLVKNVALIQEINGNISKVASLYSDLSTNFSTMFHQQHENGNGAVIPKKGTGKGKNTEA